jgi:hypothetical protein
VDFRRSKAFSKTAVSFGEGEMVGFGAFVSPYLMFPSLVWCTYTLALGGAHLLFNITDNSLVGSQKKRKIIYMELISNVC